MVVGVVAGHCIMGTHMKRICLGHLTNDFCRSCRDEEEEKIAPHLLGTCSVLSQRRRKYLGTYYMNYLEELPRINIGSLNRFIISLGVVSALRDSG